MTNRLHLLRQPYRDIAERWVAALRSGEYRQGRGWLCRDGFYCCLGVLQDKVLGCSVGSHGSGLSDSAVELSGVKEILGDLGDYGTLAGHNDGGWTFPQIADLIESVPVGLWRDECFESGKQPEEEGGRDPS